MEDFPLGLDGGLDLAAELDETGDEGRLDRQFEAVRGDDGVKRAAEGDRQLSLPAASGHRQTVEEHEARDISEANRADAPILHGGHRFQAARGYVDHDLYQPAGGGNDCGVDRPGHQRDGAVAARRAVAGGVKEDYPELGAPIFRLRHESAVHVRVPAWLEDEKLADVIEVVERVAPLLEDRPAAQRRHAAADDAKGFAGGVIVDGT